MRYCTIFALIVFAFACGEKPAARVTARPPTARVDPVTETMHGATIVDNYRWLEGDNSDPGAPAKMTSEVAAWTDAERRYTRAVLDPLPGRQALERRLAALADIGDVTLPAVRGNRYFYSARDPGDPSPVVFVRDGFLGSDRELVLPLEIDPQGLTRVTWISPSQDGRLLAFGSYRSGEADGVLRVMDVASRRLLPLEIRGTPGAAQWLPDGSGFIYQHDGRAGDPSTNRIMFHRMGAAVSTDVLLHRQFTQAENPQLAATWGPFITLSRDGHWVVAGYWITETSNDLWVANFDDFLRTGRVSTKVASVGTEGRASGTVIDGTLYLHTTKGAPNGRVVAVPASDPREARWRNVVAERPDAEIDAVAFGKDTIAVTYSKAAANVTELFDLSGRSRGMLHQPGIGVTSLAAADDQAEAFLSFQSFNRPPTIYRVDLAAPETPGTQWRELSVPVDPSAVQVEQVQYPSKDGTSVSMFLARRKDAVLDGNLPTLIVGYGALGMRMTPTFSSTLFQWFEMGGALAVPSVRGGGEFGAAWREAGSRAEKQHSFDDVIAAAEWLVAHRYTRPERLALYGGSGGGLLAAGALVQRPDLFRAVAMNEPLTDMLRYDRALPTPLWLLEFGAPGDPQQFGWLNAYSPYQHVKDGVAYPAVLLTATEAASEVHAFHARKMAARLQAATASDPAERPILLWIERDEDIDLVSAANQQLRTLVDQRLFLAWQLGMTIPTAP